MSAWRERLAVIALVAALSAVWLPRLKGPIDLRWDAAVYYTLGTALAEGKGYRLLNEPGDLEATVWPPVLPAFVALHERILGTTDPVVVGRWLRFSFLAIWIAYVAGAFLLLRRYLTFWPSAAGTAICALHITAVWLSDRCYADLPLACFATWFFLSDNWSSSRAIGVRGWVIAALAFLTRTAGIALLGVWVGEAVIGRRLKTAAARTALALLPVVAWAGFIAHVEREPSYDHPPYEYARADYALYNVSYVRNMTLVDPNRPELGRAGWTEITGRLAANLQALPGAIGGALSIAETDWPALISSLKAKPGLGRLIPWRAVPAMLWFLFGATLIGLAARAWSGQITFGLAVALYVAQLCLLPSSYQWPRYLVALAPVLALGFLDGLRTITVAVGTRWRAVSATLGTSAVIGIILFQLTALVWFFGRDFRPVEHLSWSGHQVDYSLFSYGPAFEALDRSLDWLEDRSEPPPLVVSSMAPWVFVRTGFKSVMPPLVRDQRQALALLDNVNADYLIVDTCGFSFTREYSLAQVVDPSSGWRLAYGRPNEAVAVFERGRRSSTVVHR